MPSTSTTDDERFENFTITSIIVHFLSRDSISGSVTITYSQAELNLDFEGKNALRSRVISAVSKKSKTLGMEFTSNSSDMFRRITQCFHEKQSSDDFVTISKDIANSLSEVIQSNRTIPEGAVFIIKGHASDNKKRCIVIIKAETQNDFTVDMENPGDMVQFIKNLFLTPAQKMYKVAFIIDKIGSVGDNNILKSPSDYGVSDCDVYIFDSNTNSKLSNASAKYFYNTFMSCDFEKNSAIKTMNFYQNTVDFINTKYEYDAEMRFGLISAVKTYLKMDTASVISTEKFSNHYLEEATDRQEYLNYMESKDISSDAFYRDTSLISAKLRYRTLRFENGIKITGAQEKFSYNVQVMNTNIRHILIPDGDTNEDSIRELLATLNLDNSTIVKISGFPNKEQ